MINDLNALKKEQLLEAAALFGTEVRPTMSKEELVTRLKADGVTPKLFETMTAKAGEVVEEAPVAPAPAPAGETVLIKMERLNNTYEIRGKRYTKQDPFQRVSEEDAEYLVHHGGFRIALPSEVAKYYA